MAPIIKEAGEIEEARAIMPQVTRIFNTLDSFKVNSPATWLEAGDKIKGVKEKVKEIKRIRSSILDPINKAKENTMAFFDPAITKCETIIDTLGKRMAEWRLEQEEKERIAQEKADAEAREKEHAEKEKLRKEAEEKERLAEEARQRAEKAEKKGDVKQAQVFVEKAETLKEEAKETRQEAKEVVVEAKEVKSKAEKIDGLHFRRYWKAEIIDETKLPREFLKPDEVAINKYVTDNKEKARIAGVRVYFDDKPIAE